MSRNYGQHRKRELPADGGKAKVCPRCDLWFSAKPRERICAGCRPVWRRTLGTLQPPLVNEVNPLVKPYRSSVLGVTFRPGVPLWRILALEEAAKRDGKR